MKYKITSEFRTFLREMRTEKSITTLDITRCLGKKSTATYNNIETEGLKNSLKTIELNTIYELFSSIEFRGADPYEKISYEMKEDFSKLAKELIQRFKNTMYNCSLKTQPWLLAFELYYVLYEVPEEIKEYFRNYTQEMGITFKDFILELNKNRQLQSLRNIKEKNTVCIQTDIEGNYLSWGVKYAITEEQAEEYSKMQCLPYYIINDLLFIVFYTNSKNKGEIAKRVNSLLKQYGIYVLIDSIKVENKGLSNLSPDRLDTMSKIIDMFNKYASNNKNAEQTMEKILKNMESDNFFELMSMPILATLIHFSGDKMNELEREITTKITELL